MPRAGQTNPLSDPIVEKKSCATRERHLFSLVAQCSNMNQQSNLLKKNFSHCFCYFLENVIIKQNNHRHDQEGFWECEKATTQVLFIVKEAFFSCGKY